MGEQVFAAKYGDIEILPLRLEIGALAAHGVEHQMAAVKRLLAARGDNESAALLGGGIGGGGAALLGGEKARAQHQHGIGFVGREKLAQRREQHLVGVFGIVVSRRVGDDHLWRGLYHHADVRIAAAAEPADKGAVGAGAAAQYPVAALQQRGGGQRDGGTVGEE